jgi:hypothetical protein
MWIPIFNYSVKLQRHTCSTNLIGGWSLHKKLCIICAQPPTLVGLMWDMSHQCEWLRPTCCAWSFSRPILIKYVNIKSIMISIRFVKVNLKYKIDYLIFTWNTLLGKLSMGENMFFLSYFTCRSNNEALSFL